jgi:predicted DNA-binding protein (MmcQ/YjbR family)
MHDPNRTPGKREQQIIDRVKKLTSDLPEVGVERDGFGHTVFKVRKKTFVMIGDAGDGKGSLSIKADLATQALLTKQGPWVRTPYIGQHGWVTGWGDAKLDWDEVRVLLRDAYRLAAPKKLAQEVPPEG